MMGRVRALVDRIHPPRTIPLFVTAPSIRTQRISFDFRGKTLTVEADYHTPLYETIAEVVDFDCYQLDLLDTSGHEHPRIVDVGANIGVTALCLAQLPGATVLCLEPLPANHQMLRKNLEANGANGASVLEAAVAEDDGEARLLVPDETVGCRLVRPYDTPECSTVLVKTLTLASALGPSAGPISLLKADCEGGEYALVSQITPALAERIENLTFEIHDLDKQHNLRTISAQLEALGYALRYKPDLFGRPSLHHLFATRRGTWNLARNSTLASAGRTSP